MINDIERMKTLLPRGGVMNLTNNTQGKIYEEIRGNIEKKSTRFNSVSHELDAIKSHVKNLETKIIELETDKYDQTSEKTKEISNDKSICHGFSVKNIGCIDKCAEKCKETRCNKTDTDRDNVANLSYGSSVKDLSRIGKIPGKSTGVSEFRLIEQSGEPETEDDISNCTSNDENIILLSSKSDDATVNIHATHLTRFEELQSFCKIHAPGIASKPLSSMEFSESTPSNEAYPLNIAKADRRSQVAEYERLDNHSIGTDADLLPKQSILQESYSLKEVITTSSQIKSKSEDHLRAIYYYNDSRSDADTFTEIHKENKSLPSNIPPESALPLNPEKHSYYCNESRSVFDTPREIHQENTSFPSTIPSESALPLHPKKHSHKYSLSGISSLSIQSLRSIGNTDANFENILNHSRLTEIYQQGNKHQFNEFRNCQDPIYERKDVQSTHSFPEKPSQLYLDYNISESSNSVEPSINMVHSSLGTENMDTVFIGKSVRKVENNRHQPYEKSIDSFAIQELYEKKPWENIIVEELISRNLSDELSAPSIDSSRMAETSVCPSTKSRYENLIERCQKAAQQCYDSREYTDALKVYERVLSLQRLIYGTNSLDTIDTLDSVGMCHYKQGSWEKAVCAYNERLFAIEETLGREHVHAAFTLYHIGDIHMKMKMYIRAMKSFNDAVHIYSVNGYDDLSNDALHCLKDAASQI